MAALLYLSIVYAGLLTLCIRLLDYIPESTFVDVLCSCKGDVFAGANDCGDHFLFDVCMMWCGVFVHV